MVKTGLIAALIILALLGVSLSMGKVEKINKTTDDHKLPDLQMVAPKELYLEETTGNRSIRFSTTVVNKGQGPLELLGTYNPETNKIDARQVIHKKEGLEARKVGEFIFHEGHNHWHFEKFDLFELWSLKDGKNLDKVVASTDKMSFCIQDEEILPEEIEGKPVQAVYSDCAGERQGISVGWTDTYEAELEGQVMDISQVPDGLYAFKSTVDPDNLIKEMDDQNELSPQSKDNNSNIVFIKIENGLVERLEDP